MLPFLLESVLMWKFFLVVFWSFLILTFTNIPVSAHTIGQPPFFKINGVFSNLYPIPTSSVEGFNLPQDLAADNFLVGQTLNFELDSAKMPAPKEVIDQTQFFWEFGDGTTGNGLKNSHRYPKSGSYILAIKAQYKTDPTPQLIQSVMLNVLPNKDYKLPQAVIKVNGKIIKDPLADIIKTNFNREITLDGSSSIAGSGKIVSYQWDLGDTQTSTKARLTHQYDSQLNQVFPVLRVKDENGLISDQFIELENGPDLGNNPAGFITDNLRPNKLVDNSNPLVKILIYGLIVVLSIGTTFLIVKFLKRFRFNK